MKTTPRVNVCKSPEELDKEHMKLHEQKMLDSIRIQMAVKDVSKKELSEIVLVDYQKICRMLRGAVPIDIWTMTKIANALGFDDKQRASIVSGKS